MEKVMKIRYGKGGGVVIHIDNIQHEQKERLRPMEKREGMATE